MNKFNPGDIVACNKTHLHNVTDYGVECVVFSIEGDKCMYVYVKSVCSQYTWEQVRDNPSISNSISMFPVNVDNFDLVKPFKPSFSIIKKMIKG
jgi:hypothetical protein